ncbi:MAG: hypothetical protein ACFFB3_05760 [Candidatus Hodarchaeota archaeon]
MTIDFRVTCYTEHPEAFDKKTIERRIWRKFYFKWPVYFLKMIRKAAEQTYLGFNEDPPIPRPMWGDSNPDPGCCKHLKVPCCKEKPLPEVELSEELLKGLPTITALAGLKDLNDLDKPKFADLKALYELSIEELDEEQVP